MNSKPYILRHLLLMSLCVCLGLRTFQSQQEPLLFDFSTDCSAEKIGWPEENWEQEHFALTRLENTSIVLPGDLVLEGSFERLVFLKKEDKVRSIYVEYAHGSRDEIVELATVLQRRLKLRIFEDEPGDTARLLEWKQNEISESIMATRRINYPMVDMTISKIIGKKEYKLSFWIGQIRPPISNDIVNIVRQFRKRDVDLKLLRSLDPNSRGVGGHTLLHHSVKQGLMEVAVQLIDSGAEIDSKEGGGQTPIHGAVIAGEIDCASLLVNRGADLHKRTTDGSTLVHLVSKRHTSGDRIQMLTWLLKQGVDIDAVDELGSTALHYSRSREFPEAEKLLIELGADTEIRNRAGNLFDEVPAFPTRQGN